MIHNVPELQIGGSTEKYGGRLYHVNYNRSLGEQPSKLTASFISESGVYSISDTDLQIDSAENVSIGPINLAMYPVSYRLNKSSAGKLLEVTYVDKSVKMDSIYVGLTNIHGTADLGTGDPNFITLGIDNRQRLISMYLAMCAGGNASACTLAFDIAEKLLETLPQPVYNLPMLVSCMEAKGITVDYSEIGSITGYSDYYVDYSENLRECFTNVLGDLGLGWYWNPSGDDKVHILDLRTGVAIDTVRSFVSGLNIPIQSWDESVTIEDNFCRVPNAFYRQPGGNKTESESMGLELTWRPVPLTGDGPLGHLRLTAPSGLVQNGNEYYLNKQSSAKYVLQYYKNIGEKQVPLVYKLNDPTSVNNIYIWDIPSYIDDACVKSFLGDLSGIDSSTFYPVTDAWLYDYTANLNYMDALGRFYYARGRSTDKYPGVFCYSEQKIIDTPLKSVANPQYPDLTIGNVFGTSPNPNLQTGVLNCPTSANIYGVYINEIGDRARWRYSGDTAPCDGTYYFSSVENLVNSVTCLSNLINTVMTGTSIETLPSNARLECLKDYDAYPYFLVCANAAELTAINDQIDRIDFHAFIKGSFNEYVQTKPTDSYYYWPTVQKFNRNQICSGNVMKLDVVNQEISPEDIMYHLQLAEPDVPLNYIINNLNAGTLDAAISAIASERYGTQAFSKQEPSATISIDTAATGMVVNDEFIRFLNGISASVQQDGVKINYSFGTKVAKLPSPEVFKQKYLLSILPRLKAELSSVSFQQSEAYKPKVFCE
jgi:hypothetical protein